MIYLLKGKWSVIEKLDQILLNQLAEEMGSIIPPEHSKMHICKTNY